MSPTPAVCCVAAGRTESTRALRHRCHGKKLRWPRSLAEQTRRRRMRQNQPVPCPCPQIDQLRAELLQERSSRQDLECDKVSLERQVRLRCGGAGPSPQPWGQPEGRWTPCPGEGCRAKRLGAAPLLSRASLGEGPCSQGVFPAGKPFPLLLPALDTAHPHPPHAPSLARASLEPSGTSPGWHSRRIPPFPCSSPPACQGLHSKPFVT